ncbi:MAG: sigma-70 family RNA polymerase sigma factor [Hyphomonas sp.]|nr:sigma-70 family RNA polymerase sigma factor [Hyphomonas sp.]
MNEQPHIPSNRLVGEYLNARDALVRFLTARTGSAAEAEDIVQDMFLKVQAIDPTGIETPTAFLYRLASNLFVDKLRSARRSRARDEAYAKTHTEAAGDDLVAETPDPQQVVDSRQQLRQLITAVEALPPQCQRVFKLHKLDGLSYAEVARSLGISKSAVEKHMMSALRRLSEHRG